MTQPVHNCTAISSDLRLSCGSRCCMTRILIADDSAPVRCVVRTFLELTPDWQVCGEAVDGTDAVEKARQLTPDLIVMDFSMPDMNGVEAALEIAKSGTDTPILLFTLHLSPQVVELARRAGMRGAISKAEISQMSYAIRALQRGETFFHPN
jgi:DNA-binding NarL/FixJ family response regulator